MDAQIGREAATSSVSCVGRPADLRDWALFAQATKRWGSLPIDRKRLTNAHAAPSLAQYRAMPSLASRWVMGLTASQWGRSVVGPVSQHTGSS